MRLTSFEQENIVKLSRLKFGNDVRVILFGSRTDDRKRGGDIDLLIIPAPELDTQTLTILHVQFLASLKMTIGDQKIDILIKTPEKEGDTFYKQVEYNGIALC